LTAACHYFWQNATSGGSTKTPYFQQLNYPNATTEVRFSIGLQGGTPSPTVLFSARKRFSAKNALNKVFALFSAGGVRVRERLNIRARARESGIGVGKYRFLLGKAPAISGGKGVA
jgi:hypothetical protein